MPLAESAWPGETTGMEYAWGALLICGSLAGWILNLLGLPGNWIVLGLCVVYAHFGPSVGRSDVGWGIVLWLLALALLGELVEFLAAFWGTQRAGGSKRAAALALVGSIAGGVAGMFVGVPVPVVGSLIGAILCASLGALIGAVLGEQWKGRTKDESLRVGSAAFWSRMIGTVSKTLVGAVMVALVIAAVFI